MSIEIRNLTKHFGAFTALNDVNLAVRPGELLALLGPSGSGKTTVLRIVAGLEFADAGGGRVLFDGEDVTDSSAASRRVGFAFQHYALFRHLTVFENVAFGLRVRPRASRPNEAEIRRRVTELLRLVQLEHLEGRWPSQLSGGQRQRVALARALAVEPKVLLLDEPVGALDAQVRRELRRWLRQLHQEIHLTTIFVTHDQDEALEVADRIVLMNHGRIEQVGTPEEVYDHPANLFVAGFIGAPEMNQIPGTLEHRNGEIRFIATGLDIPVPASKAGDAPSGTSVVLGVRPEHVSIAQDSDAKATVAAVVSMVEQMGANTLTVLVPDGDTSGARLRMLTNRLDGIREGDRLRVRLDLAQIHLFDTKSGGNLAR